MAFIDTSDDTYPVTREDIETALPDVIFSDENPPAPYKPVLPALSPPTPEATEQLVEGAPEEVGGVWRQTWTVEAKVIQTITRLQYISALQSLGGLTAVSAAILAKPVTDPIRIYFEETPIFDREDTRFDAFSAEMEADEEDVNTVFNLGVTIDP